MSININNINNINNFYNQGIGSFLLKKIHSDMLIDALKEEVWVENDGNKNVFCSDNEFLSLPDWMYKAHDTSTNTDTNTDTDTDTNTDPYLNEHEKEFTIKQNIKNLTPKIYFDYFSILFNSPYILGIDKLFHSKITVNSIALWNGVGDFNWHWDGPGNDDIYALVYLSDYKKWPRKFGAGLEYGTAQMSEQGYKNIKQKGVLYPDNGRIIIGENRNPLWVHRTQHYSEQALNDKINRFTFLVTMKLTSLLPIARLPDYQNYQIAR